LLFSLHSRDTSSIIVTSPGSGEGKSVTAANLAIAIATSGYQVLLVDADLRMPNVHRFFGLPNELGLTSLLHIDPTNKLSPSFEKMPQELKSCVQNTSVPNLHVITSGYKPSNPAEVLGSAAMQFWSRAFQSGNDVVIYDTPPNLVVADSSSLAVATGASVAVVAGAGKTRLSSISRSIEQLRKLDVNVLGCVVNAVNPSESQYSYGGDYYYSDKPPRNGRRR
jgi:capsular exopolysaccharide synthesis family protein